MARRSQIEKDYRKADKALALLVAQDQIRDFLKCIGSKGGKATSKAKAAAAKRNAKQPRPRKGTK